MVRRCNMNVEIDVGDLIIFYGVGAYSPTESPNLFLSMEMPAVLLYNENNDFFQNKYMVRSGLHTYKLIDDRTVDK